MTRIGALRERLSWTQAELADFIGHSQPLVSLYESGTPEKRTGTPEKRPLSIMLDRLAIERGWPDLTAEAFRGNAVEAGSQPKDAA